MSHYYLDSSALVKQYVVEPGTTWINSLHNVENTLYSARISAAEIVAAFFLRVRTGTLVLSNAQAATHQFKTDFSTFYQIVEITEQVVDTALFLVEKHNLRGYDSVQLAAVVELHNIRTDLSLSPIVFVCADEKLNTAAMVEGLIVENPNTY